MKKQIMLFFALLLAVQINANNISVSNVSLTGQNTTDKFWLVQFDISWENAWRVSSTPSNHDAAWVFVKYRVASGEWKHAWLNETGHTAPTGSRIDNGLLTPGLVFNATTNPGMGAFISSDATGLFPTFTKNAVQLRWNYGSNGVADDAWIDIQVFAIEMVYVPQGAFTVGTGGTETGSFTNGSWTAGNTIALSIANEDPLSVAQSAGSLWGTTTTGNSSIGAAGSLAATFPKGFGAFYCMKYEISQQGYVDFLNSLKTSQATIRYATGLNNIRYGITVSNWVFSTSTPYVAYNALSWSDLAAYLDWSGLRPMTELEFEKACRGVAGEVANEYAWGSTDIAQNTQLNNAGLSNETGLATANCQYGNSARAWGNSCRLHVSPVMHPMRVGIFATATSGRVQAGATFYGIMEMSGNVRERAITVGNPEGRGFTGTHGNGTLDATTGEADVLTWPGISATGVGFRGGNYFQSEAVLRVSDRAEAAYTKTERFEQIYYFIIYCTSLDNTGCYQCAGEPNFIADFGGRGVRSE